MLESDWETCLSLLSVEGVFEILGDVDAKCRQLFSHAALAIIFLASSGKEYQMYHVSSITISFNLSA
jgi:hypothetical protein